MGMAPIWEGLEVPSWPPSGHRATSMPSQTSASLSLATTSRVIRVPGAGGGLPLPERNRLGQEGGENTAEQKADLQAGPGGDTP